MTVDVIIPTYKPDESFFSLLDKLESQTVKVRRIIVINTEEQYFQRLVFGKRFKEEYHNLAIKHISMQEFDHGGTRKMAAALTDADVFVMMTQDAIPADDRLLEHLLEALTDEKVAVSYGRQLATDDAGEIEKYTRVFNYPPTSCVKTAADLPKLGIKTFFCSDVCAAYKRDIYEALGGFVKKTIFNEDMIYAAAAVKAGYSIAYAADAKVYHCHNYTGVEQLKRNFDLGVSQAQYPEVFGEISSESEGMTMVKQTMGHLWKSGHKRQILRLIYASGCKYIGYRLGKSYQKLPEKIVMKCTSNQYYWKN